MTLRSATLSLTLLLSACSAVLGIEEATLDEDLENAIARQSCVLNSDCDREQVCIFRVCSPPCASDRDCDDDLACLRTDEATVCIEPDDSACERSDDCPDGTVCAQGVCRTACAVASSDNACLEDQACIAGACRGSRLDGDGIASLLDGGNDAGDVSNAGSDGGAHPPNDGSVREDVGVDSGEPAPPACEAADKNCENGTLYTCRSDETLDQGTPCAYVCSGDACSGECVPQDRRCLQETLQECNDEGLWQQVEECPRVCTLDGCVDRCETGTKQCNDTELLVCTNAGAFAHQQDCDYVCRSGACVGECVPDDVQCNGNSTETCNADGEWIAGSDCEFDCAGDACVGECAPNDTRCQPGSSAVLETCGSNFMWGDAETCGFYCDASAQACAGECTPDDARCQSGSDTGIETCGDDFEWGSATQCDYACIDATGECGGVCDPNAHQCQPGSNTTRQTCSSAAQWGTNFTCPFVCVSGTGECGGSCTPGAPVCNNASPVSEARQCTAAGAWTTLDTCSFPTEICSGGACVANASFNVGNATQLPDPNTEGTGVLLGFKITVANRVDVVRFGLRGRGTGAFVKLAVYSDVGDRPSALLGSSGTAAVINGAVEVDPVTALSLNAGSYWLMATFDANAQTWWEDSAGPTAWYMNHSFASALPGTFVVDPSRTFTGYTYNYYLVVRQALQ